MVVAAAVAAVDTYCTDLYVHGNSIYRSAVASRSVRRRSSQFTLVEGMTGVCDACTKQQQQQLRAFEYM
eukprot:1766-Heterococcus_DN1.PRE.2